MEVTKYVITNNLSVLYNTREEAEAAFEAESSKVGNSVCKRCFLSVCTQ